MPLEFLGLLLYPLKFGMKQSLTPGNFAKLGYRLWKIQGQKLRPFEFHMIFS